MGSEFTAQLQVEGEGALRNRLPIVKKAHFVAEEYEGAIRTLRINGATVISEPTSAYVYVLIIACYIACIGCIYMHTYIQCICIL